MDDYDIGDVDVASNTHPICSTHGSCVASIDCAIVTYGGSRQTSERSNTTGDR